MRVEPGQEYYVQVGCTVLQFKLEEKAEKKKSCCSRLLKRKQDQNPRLKAYMSRTLNPKAPYKNEVPDLDQVSRKYEDGKNQLMFDYINWST